MFTLSLIIKIVYFIFNCITKILHDLLVINSSNLNKNNTSTKI